MAARALIVILVVLNLGIAAWWALRKDPPVPEPAPVPAGVAGLELLPGSAGISAEQAAAPALPAPEPTAAATPAAAPATSTPAAPAAAAPRCLSLGTFADRAAAEAAQQRMGTGIERARVREVADAGAGSYRVLLPSGGDREAARALAARIAAAGFGDYYILAQGEQANTIALGQYRNREGAERRQAALVAAGFPAQLVASGGNTTAQWWLDVHLAADAQPAAIRRQSGAGRQQPLDCALLR